MVTKSPDFNQEDFEKRVISQQEQHFTQANQTPIATQYRVQTHDKRELYEHFKHSTLPDTSIGIKQFFEQDNNLEIKTEITSKDFRMGINKWKEHSSTSPLGSHLGHYHVQVLHQMEGEAEGWTEMFLWIHSTTINLTAQHNIILQQWRKVHTLMKPKDPGIPKINRLRPLNIIEVNLNLLLRIILARRLLKQAEKNKEIVDETWGLRKHQSSGDLGLQKVLTLELTVRTNRLRCKIMLQLHHTTNSHTNLL